jgi:hypothetical protein
MASSSRFKRLAAISLLAFVGSYAGASLVVTTSVGHRVSSDGAIRLRRSDAVQSAADNSIYLPRGIVIGINNLALDKGQC